MTELTFDFDFDNMGSFRPVLEELHRRYGEKVWVRRSSFRGWHIWVKDLDFAPEQEMKLRDELGDCQGRRAGDRARLQGGLNTSRLFTVKGTVYKGEKVVRSAGEWMSYEQWRERYAKEERTT